MASTCQGIINTRDKIFELTKYHHRNYKQDEEISSNFRESNSHRDVLEHGFLMRPHISDTLIKIFGQSPNENPYLNYKQDEKISLIKHIKIRDMDLFSPMNNSNAITLTKRPDDYPKAHTQIQGRKKRS